jgi:hypothetical protein
LSASPTSVALRPETVGLSLALSAQRLVQYLRLVLESLWQERSDYFLTANTFFRSSSEQREQFVVLI